MPKTSKLYQFINYRMRVTLHDSRQFVGKFMAFDKHMNLVLGDCEEFRKIIPKGKKGEEKEEKRTLGLIILRGESIVSMNVEGPPPAEDSRLKTLQKEGFQPLGIAKAAARGITIPASLSSAPMHGLGAPLPNLGAPAPNLMAPQLGRPPMGVNVPPPPHGFMRPPMQGMPFPPPPMMGGPFAPPPMMGGQLPPPHFGRGMPPMPPQFRGGPPMNFPPTQQPPPSGGNMQ